MESRHWILVALAVLWAGSKVWSKRAAIVASARGTWQRLAPVAARIGGLKPAATVLVIGVLLWPEISRFLPKPAPIDKAIAIDLVDEFFDAQELAFRKLQGSKANKLRAGDFATEADAVKWFETEFREAKKSAITSLAEYEYEKFGGEKWTPEAEAVIADQWAAGGGK